MSGAVAGGRRRAPTVQQPSTAAATAHNTGLGERLPHTDCIPDVNGPIKYVGEVQRLAQKVMLEILDLH